VTISKNGGPKAKRNAKQPAPVPLALEPEESAKAAGLRYVSDLMPGLVREKDGDSFRYRDQSGDIITDEKTLRRIKSLAIPPAYQHVWICPHEHGHLQATGRDARGRKQYRYHPRWREVRDETKYGRMIQFAQALPGIRRRVEEDLAQPGLPREKVLATVLKLLESTLIRVGNEEYAKANRSFGLTTMRNRHVKVSKSELRFTFRGKSGKDHNVGIKDRRLAGIVRRCLDLPGQELFQYLDDDGARQSIDSADVNEYLREIAGDAFSAKDFRTWAGTVQCALSLQAFEDCETAADMKKNVNEAIKAVAQMLGNTPTICRKCYVHPTVLEAYLEGTLLGWLPARGEAVQAEGTGDLRREERAVADLLRRRLSEAA